MTDDPSNTSQQILLINEKQPTVYRSQNRHLV